MQQLEKNIIPCPIRHLVAQHLHVAMLPAAPDLTRGAKPSSYYLRYGPQIAALRAQGHSNAEIGPMIGLSASSVAPAYSRYRKSIQGEGK